MGSVLTLGLSEIKVGVAATNGTMPTTLAKIGKTYRDTCKMTQEASEVMEHFEEGNAAPQYRKKTRKIPKLTFSIMDPDEAFLTSFVGGVTDSGTGWGFDGTETVADKAIQVVTEAGLDISIPNADIEAVVNADFSAKGLFLVDFTVVPKAVSAGKAIYAKAKAS